MGITLSGLAPDKFSTARCMGLVTRTVVGTGTGSSRPKRRRCFPTLGRAGICRLNRTLVREVNGGD